MWIIILIVAWIAISLHDSKQAAKYKAVTQKARDEGWYDPTNEKEYKKLWQDFYYNWHYEGGTLVPEKYRAYCAVNEKALSGYCVAWCAEQSLKRGFQPSIHPKNTYYDKRNMDVYKGWKEWYDEYAEIYNKTGRIYHK